ncbi:MAG: PAS domain S-box protein [Prochlorothrix sp.]
MPQLTQWSQQDRSRFFDLSLDLLCKANFDGYFLYLNPAGQKLLGFDMDFLLATPFMDLVHPDDREATQQALKQLQDNQPCRAFENRYRCQDGHYCWLSWVSIPVQEEGVIYGVARDVTDRKQQEERLCLMERAMNHARNGIIITDATQPNNPVIYANQSVERITGYALTTLVGQNCRIFQGSDHHQPDLVHVRQAVHQGHSCEAVLRNYRQDGSMFWNELHIAPVYDDKKQLTHFIGIQNDITVQKRAEAELLNNEFHLRTLINTISDGLLVVDVDGKILFVNPAAERIFGQSETALLTQDFGLPFVSDQRIPVGIRNPERFLMTEMTATQVVWRDQKAFLVSLRDVTDRNEAEEALRKKEEEFRLIFEMAPTGMAIATPQGQLLHVNQAFQDMLGYPAQDVLHHALGDFMHPQTLGHWQSLQAQLLWDQESSPPCLEQQFVAASGQTVYTLMQVTLLRDPEGNPLQLICQFVDISDRRETEAALQASEQFLRSLFHNLEEYIAVFAVTQGREGPEFRYLSLNSAYEKVTSLKTEVIQGSTLDQVLTSDHAASLSSQYRDCLQRGERLTYEEHVQWGGQSQWWLTSLTPIYDQYQRIDRVISSSIDLTARRQMEMALRHSEHRYRQIVETATEGIWVLDQWHQTSFVNRQAAEMLGYDAAAMVGQSFFQFVAPDSFHQAYGYLQQCQVEQCSRHDFQFCRKDQTPLWTLLSASPLLDEQDQYMGALIMLTDITERRQAEEKLRNMALYDSLTQLPNRTLFIDRLNHLLQRYQRQPSTCFAVLFLDLDRFKVINDSLGHSIGDQLLIAFSRLVESLIRPADTLARLGGDEFTILLEDLSSAEDAYTIAERINLALTQPFHLEGFEVFTNTSIGITFGQSEVYEAETLLRDADTAMYRAKNQGRGCYAVFDAAMHQAALDRLHLEVDLRHALDRQEMQVFYQPIVCLETGTLAGFEALLRWFHPCQGLISPNRFIPLAEETGLIVELGQFILHEACRQAQEWHQRYPHHPPLVMGVNLSSRQLSQTQLIPSILQTLLETQFPPQQLKLEITETCLMENPELAASMLKKLDQAGIKLALDDFGTGYSSLNYLRRFPVHTLKIDRSFVSSLDQGGEDLEIIRTITALAHNLRMNVIAEGLETQWQWQQLRDLGCELGQGFFFAKPLERSAAEALVLQTNPWSPPASGEVEQQTLAPTYSS